jgi:endonuclease YncB( thermonuclease family)
MDVAGESARTEILAGRGGDGKRGGESLARIADGDTVQMGATRILGIGTPETPA